MAVGGGKVAAALHRIHFRPRCASKWVIVDNATEFASKEMDDWACAK
jgi:hypothetical protein